MQRGLPDTVSRLAALDRQQMRANKPRLAKGVFSLCKLLDFFSQRVIGFLVILHGLVLGG
jgi:hypothetical protein